MESSSLALLCSVSLYESSSSIRISYPTRMNQTSLRLELVPRDLDSPLTPADLPRGSTLSICRTRIRRRRRRSRREGTKPFPGLLKSELFGSDFVSSPMSPCTPNILRFKTMVSLVTPLLLSLLARSWMHLLCKMTST
ncbi:protein FIZZY-RELATED 3-like isoform X2 [Raphanus sativus]|uniref:Protein FIZZY-RELATED 3-like isoform X2 n=1 Tax=Raphanus sativus TaxID=3726 RepID=A0A9W3BX38_RAPSA|nr:protein FIZZY-RELATED 3-like isoform X2 [Raphanus sativus]